MAIIITDECINCGACEPECQNNAIYQGGEEWRFSDGTDLKGEYRGLSTDKIVDAESAQPPVTDVYDGNELYYIVPDKCTECVGFHDEPQCAAVCPVDCCIDEPNHRETDEQLLAKKASMHL